jgi:hypothetical protein
MKLQEMRDAYILINAGIVLVNEVLCAKVERGTQEILVSSVCVHCMPA